MDLEFGEFEGFGRFDVESWRFVSWQQAWSGAKKIIQLDGAGRWERYHMAYQDSVGAWSLGGGLSYYDIYPDAFSESWIHIPLLRPQDYERNDYSASRMSLGALSLNVSRSFRGFDIEFELSQFVYGNDHVEREAAADPAPAETEDHGGWFGGSFAEISVGYRY
jgi:hypothetical protein